MQLNLQWGEGEGSSGGDELYQETIVISDELTPHFVVVSRAPTALPIRKAEPAELVGARGAGHVVAPLVLLD